MSYDYSYLSDGLKESKNVVVVWMCLSILLGVLIIVATISFPNGSIDLLHVNEELLEGGGDFFLKYLFIVLAVERAAAVFVDMFRRQSKVNWNLRIRRISEILDQVKPPLAVLKLIYLREHNVVQELTQKDLLNGIESVTSKKATDEDYIAYLTSTKHAYEFLRLKYNSIGNRYVSRVVFVGAIFLAIFGLSIFQDIFGSIEEIGTSVDGVFIALSDFQQRLLRLADILVTGGLLGGGSSGLNSLAHKVDEMVNRP